MGICESKKNEPNTKNYRINEVEIKDSQLKQIDKNIIKVSPSICKIESKNHIGSGFLIRLNTLNKELFCLMTNQHVITREMVQLKEEIEILYNCEENNLKIKLNNNERYIKDYIDIDLDIIIIEILPKDNINDIYFLYPEINNINNIINKNIYIPQYPAKLNFCYSCGNIKNTNNNEIIYNATTKSGSSGSPIFLENSIKVIAIHKQGNIKKTENYGNFLYPIIQLLKNNNINNEIKLNNINKQGEISRYQYDDGDYYIGPLLNGLPNGKGKIYYKNGNIHYEGDMINGKREGYGKENYDNGYYIGEFKNNKRNGKGKYIWKNGVIYEGEYINGLSEGYGKDIYKDGSYYIGYWQKDLKHGKGKQFYKDGTLKSDIDFVNGKFEGFGRYNFENGEYFIGHFHNGLKEGKGKFYYKNGKIKYDGNIINDKYEGYGRYNYLNGEYYIGQWHNDLKEGNGKIYYNNGNIKYEGDFKNDKFEGYGRYNYLNGEYYIGQWSQDKKHGKGILYYPNGLIKNDGFFFNDKFEG